MIMKLMNSCEFLDKNIPILKNKINNDYTLVVINTIDTESSKIYINSKKRMAKKLGIKIIIEELYNIDTNELVKKIDAFNNNKNVNGIIIQLPLADNLDENVVLDSISPLKDVDGLTSYNIGKLIKNEKTIIPATAKGVIDLLDYYKVSVEGKNIVVIGKSIIVGKPISSLLINKGATVTVCHSKTKNIDIFTKNADIIIIGIGKANYLTGTMIKDGTIIVDVGINKIDGKVYGDVDFSSVKDKASYITPVPGGVGLMTVYELMNNLYELNNM